MILIRWGLTGSTGFLLFLIEQNFYFSPILFCLEDEKREGLPVWAAPPFSMVSLYCEGRAWSRSVRCLLGILMAAAILPAGPVWPMKSPGIILGISCAYMYFLPSLIVAILVRVEALICSRRILCIVGIACASGQ